MTGHKHQSNGYLELILFSIFAGIVGVMVKMVKGLDVNTIIFFRASIAVVFIFIVVLFMKRAKELSLQYPVQTMLVGVFQGLCFVFYFGSIMQTSVSNAIFLLYTAPIFTVIFAAIFLHEKIEKETIIGMLITLAGIIFILDPRTFSFNSTQTIGNLFGLLAGALYAAMAVTAKPLMKKVSGYYVVFWQCVITALMFIFFVRIESTAVLISNWGKLLIIGIVCTGIAFILFMQGLQKVAAQKVFVITALEPLAGTIAALIVLSEMPSYMTIIGAVLIIYGVYRMTNLEKNNKRNT